jgi:DNA mismatch repair protein MutL
VEWQDGTTLQLLLGLPDRLTRPRPDWIKVAINGRFVQSPELEHTIVQAFRRTMPRDRYPLCIVQLQVPPDQVDWHRQPAKTAIYLENLADRQAQITAGIHQALRLESAPQQNQRVGNLLKTAEAAADYRSAGASRSLMELKALAQVHDRYILAQHPTGMWLVEQHIAHERVLYEQLLERWQLVPLEPPIVLDQLTVAQVEQLQRIGLDVTEFGEHLWAVRTAPALLQVRDDCRSALLELSSGGDLQTAQVATACRSAIRNGTPMTLPDMQKLLDQWQRTQHPQTCPHGRPIYLSLEESSLSRFFRRHWVIGKSHGI